MESDHIMDRGLYACKDRTHSFIPRHQTTSEEESGKTRCGQIDEGGGKEYHPDEKEIFQFVCDCGGAEICICGRLSDASGRGKSWVCQRFRVLHRVWHGPYCKSIQQTDGEAECEP
eukprot:11475678-Heterocapsa_arctica.AAC.1